MDSRVEWLLEALLKGESIDNFEPRSRLEEYLESVIEKSGVDNLQIPRSRLDALLYEMADKAPDDYANAKKAGLDEFLKVRNGNYLFYTWTGTTIPQIDTSNFTSMGYMFDGCTNLTSIPLIDTSNVTHTSHMFGGCTNLTSIPQLDTSKVTNTSYMFSYCSSLTSIPQLNTSNVTNMEFMFGYSTKLTSIPQIDTSKVTKMGNMFSGCTGLTTIPTLDMRSVTSCSSMFKSCAKLTECWIKNIKTSMQVGSGTSYGHLLTLESLLHLIKEVRNTGSAIKLTVGTANLAKLTGLYVKLITITDEMRAEDDLIDSKYPFEVCESTDEGAMTLSDYYTLKNLTVA